MQSVPHISPETFRALNLSVDEDGFLINPNEWTSEIAEQMAEASGIDFLDDYHWEVIFYLRKKYFTLGAMAPMRLVCKKMHVDKETIKASFGSCHNLWQIAGLPNPGEEAISYMN